MHIRHLEKIFSIDEVVPIDVLPVFLADTITMLFMQVRFCGSHTFPYQFLLLNTITPNDTYFLAFRNIV